MSRRRATAEVVLCSGYPTQLAIAALLASVGIRPEPGGALSPAFIFAVSAIDTVVLLALIFFFILRAGERPAAIFLGRRAAWPEVRHGLMTLPLIFLLVILVQLAIRLFAPFLHNVEISPFAPMLGSRWLLAGFVALVLVAGGLREELQRAFLLHRFEQQLGGPVAGVIITSAAFGLGHIVQGWDAGILTGLLGAFWAVVYLARRSVVSTVTSHALFNVTQIALGYVMLTPASQGF